MNVAVQGIQKPSCGDCGVVAGSFHLEGCDVARCGYLGIQRLQCSHPGSECNTRWSGVWPGERECEEYGWYARFIPGSGWQQCEKDDEGAGPDLNRLYWECRWDVSLQRMVR